MHLRIPHQNTGDLERQVHPLVQIEGERIGLFHARYQRSQARREPGQSAEGSIDMKPQLLVPTEVRESGEIVNRSGVDGTGVPDHAERAKPRLPVGRDGLSQLGK